MCLIKSYVSSEQPGELFLSCVRPEGGCERDIVMVVILLPSQPATSTQEPTNHLPVRFAGNHLCLSCSDRCSHDKTSNSLPLFTHRRPGSTSRRSGVVAWSWLTPGLGAVSTDPSLPCWGTWSWSCNTQCNSQLRFMPPYKCPSWNYVASQALW